MMMGFFFDRGWTVAKFVCGIIGILTGIIVLGVTVLAVYDGITKRSLQVEESVVE